MNKDIKLKELTDMQEEFCYAYVYITLFDAVEAYRIVSNLKDERAIGRAAKILLSEPNVRARIDELMKERHDTPVVDKFWVLKKIKKIVDDCDGKPQFQLKALELLGKHLGLFAETITLDEHKDAADVAQSAFENRKKLILFKNKLEEEKVGESNVDAKTTGEASST